MIERERDWLLKKLRRAKNHFQTLKIENDQLRGDADIADGGHLDEISLDSASLSMTSLSQDSSYILDIHQRNVGRNLAPISGRDMFLSSGAGTIDRGFVVSRDRSLLSAAAPRPISYDEKGRYRPSGSDGGLRPVTKHPNDNKSPHERRAIGQLVSLRARQEALRDLVDQCARSCDRGPWAKARVHHR
jgi:hypothetical protein